MFRFVTSVALTVIGVAVFLVLLRRPRSQQPLTWAQAMAAAMGVFALMLLGYGVVPHEWLTWADSSLGLREDKIIVDTYAVDISGRAVRDVVVSGIYVVLLVLNVVFWTMWQKRGQAKRPAAPPSAAPAKISAFSRPVVKRP